MRRYFGLWRRAVAAIKRKATENFFEFRLFYCPAFSVIVHKWYKLVASCPIEVRGYSIHTDWKNLKLGPWYFPHGQEILFYYEWGMLIPWYREFNYLLWSSLANVCFWSADLDTALLQSLFYLFIFLHRLSRGGPGVMCDAALFVFFFKFV